MKIVKTTEKGIDHLHSVLQQKPRTVTKVSFWRIPHRTQKEDIGLKLARYKIDDFSLETLECKNPKSELTLDNVEFENLLTFLSENYEPFKQGIKKYIPIDDRFDPESIEHLRAIFDNEDKEELLKFVVQHNILPEELISGLRPHSQEQVTIKFH